MWRGSSIRPVALGDDESSRSEGTATGLAVGPIPSVRVRAMLSSYRLTVVNDGVGEGDLIPAHSNAPEWTRTTTDHTVHKALNLARLPIPPQALEAASIALRGRLGVDLGLGRVG